jgi:hypothetical protein
MWIDADLAILDFSMKIERIVADHPEGHVFISSEHSGSSTLVNSGAILVRNSAFGRKFLSDWWNFADRKMYSDQEQFDLLYKHSLNMNRNGLELELEMDIKMEINMGIDGQEKGEEKEGSRGRGHRYDLKSIVVILPPDAINSDPPAMTRQRENNQVLHLMGEHAPFRIKAFSTGFHEICKHIRSGTDSEGGVTPLPRQLGLNQSNLLKWSLQEYSIEAQVRLHRYESKAARGLNTLSDSRHFANAGKIMIMIMIMIMLIYIIDNR